MATSVLDRKSLLEYEELRVPSVPLVDTTECVHIFTESTNVEIEEEQAKVSKAFYLLGPPLIYSVLRENTRTTPGRYFANSDTRMFSTNWVTQTVTFTDWRTF